MTAKEILQLAAVLNTQSVPLLNRHKPDSPTIAHALAMLDELPGVLENAFAEAELFDDIATGNARQQALIRRFFRLGL